MNAKSNSTFQTFVIHVFHDYLLGYTMKFLKPCNHPALSLKKEPRTVTETSIILDKGAHLSEIKGHAVTPDNVQQASDMEAILTTIYSSRVAAIYRGNCP